MTKWGEVASTALFTRVQDTNLTPGCEKLASSNNGKQAQELDFY